MKNKFIWLGLIFLLVAAMLLSSCSTSTTSTTSTSATTKTTTTITTQTTAATVTTTTPTTTAATGNWWDSLGTPQYGGELVLRANQDVASFDPYVNPGYASIMSGWLQRLFSDDWTLDPTVFAYNIAFRPPQFVKGLLAASYEFPDPNTLVVHLRQGVHWQNIPPVNGREFNADDVVFHFDRLLGLAPGFIVSPYFSTVTSYRDLISISSNGQYTVVFKFKTPNPEFILEGFMALGDELDIEAPEAVKLWGDLIDWHHAIGTGPFMLQDYIPSSSAKLVKNPNYWGYDERYPQNQLPYINSIVMLIIPDTASTLAAVRTGKIDFIDSVTPTMAQTIQKSNPKVLQLTVPGSGAMTVDPRNDKPPFNDIKVRQALQMAINLQSIATDYYNGTCSPDPSSLTSNYMNGWGFPYDQWPQDLKDQYAYNPTAAKKLLADAGYSNGFTTNVVANSAGDLALLLIVKDEFAAINVNMDIRPMDAVSWTSFVKSGRKQDQLAYNTGGKLGLTYEPLRQFSNFHTNTNYLLIADPVYDAFYDKALAANSVAAVQQVMIDCNKYVAQQHFTICLVAPTTYTLYQPWLKGYDGQTNSIYGATGPLQLGFYGARFWIDQKLKDAMGR